MVGMTGPYNSVTGVEKEMIVSRFINSMPVRMEAAKGMVELHSVIVDVDEATGKAQAIRRHNDYGD
ncbi:MAG: metallophosphoesterase [Bryobacterales bacterium]|nr:metallophosphoesterase [Bryobacterales bacterium]